MISQVLEMKMLAFSAKVSNQKYLLAIKNTFTTLTPLIIVGAFSLLVKSVVADPKNGLAAIDGFGFLAVLGPTFGKIQYATYNILALFAVFLISLELAKRNDLKGYIPSIFSMACYVSVIPTNIMVNGELINNVISRNYTNTSALFLAIIVAILSSELFAILSRAKFLQIKLHSAVPENVARAFAALLPIAFGLFIFSVSEQIFESIFSLTTYDAIYKVVQVPLSNVIQGLPGILLLMLVAQVFWVFGIHGNQIIKPIREPLLLSAINENMEAFEAGLEVPNIVTMSFWDIYGSMGGSGVTIGLIVAVFFFSKREDYKEVSKLSTVPGLFNINETMTFGMPIVLNPILMIPFILTPLITLTIGYISTAIGFAGKTIFLVPWTTPPIMSAYIATKGSMGAVITQIICIVVAFLIYVPFVKMANRIPSVNEEQN